MYNRNGLETMSIFRRRVRVSTHTVMVAGVSVRYQRVGEDTASEPIVLVHGLSGSTRWWTRNIASLAQHHCVYLVDLPGFGAMHRSPTRFMLAQAGAWLVTWMDAVGLKRVHLVGHSMGGYICIWIAAHHPERVYRLVLVSPAVLAKVHSVLGYAVPLLIAFRYLTPSFFLILSFDALRAGPLTLLHAAHDLLRQDVHNELKAITAPTLLVWGTNDTLVPPTLGHVLRGEIANARLLILKNAAHVSMFDQPQRFNEAVNAFLRGEVVGE